MRTWDGTKWVECDWVRWTLRAAGTGAWRLVDWAILKLAERYKNREKPVLNAPRA